MHKYTFVLIAVPTYGVLTHCDQIDTTSEEFREKEMAFKEKLGLQNNQYLRCKNYCDEYDEDHGTDRMQYRIPDIEIPVIKFLSQVV